MDILSQYDGVTLNLMVAGLVDGSNAYRLADAVDEGLNTVKHAGQDVERVVLDVAAAVFADFAVTGMLHRLCDQAASAGAQLSLRAASREMAASVAAGGLTGDISVEGPAR